MVDDFATHIRMPEECRGEDCTLIFRIAVGMDYMNIFQAMSMGDSSSSMSVELAKVSSKLTLTINTEIGLVAEEDHASNRNETSQVVFLSIRELGQIDTLDLSADFGVVVEDIRGGSEKVAVFRVTSETFVMIGDFSQRLPMEIRERWAKIVMLVEVMRLDDGTSRVIIILGSRFLVCGPCLFFEA